MYTAIRRPQVDAITAVARASDVSFISKTPMIPTVRTCMRYIPRLFGWTSVPVTIYALRTFSATPAIRKNASLSILLPNSA